MKKLISLLMLFTLGMLMSVPLGFAAGEEEEDEEKKKIVITEANPGDYFKFMFETRSRNGTGQIFIDVFTRSLCQVKDIMALDEQLDATRDSLRSAAFQGKETKDLKIKYRAILAEMYFVRNIQKSKPGLLNKRDLEKIEAGQQQNLDTLEEEMEVIFVDEEKWFTTTVFASYFKLWEHKYEEKVLNNYVRCEDGAWAQVTSTWNEFLENMNSLEIDVEKYEGKPFGLDNFNFEPDFDTNFDDITVFDELEPLFPYDDFKKHEQESEKDITIPVSLEDVARDSSRPTFENVLDTLEKNKLSYEIELDYAMRKARYELLYGAGGALPAQNLDGIVHELNNLIQENNVADFPYIQDAVDTIYGKQCN
ncbi:hypothetical protein HOD30_05605 [Candidatus Peregrinibacteria bacterium]|jgi:hypothetical protein|nr:hypothetical protein [Candidatus Peregrinibacteria bacterium]MBT4631497.1 hypothetical protein [Candidatus Peregrinibacteria bacterium]MBT5516474.1 hypothetical protein [Candidatus Peregrinibacteria bacterium]MBT5823886.1 hypothetical protein [Candidatus Peregrinibacteria bacterium]